MDNSVNESTEIIIELISGILVIVLLILVLSMVHEGTPLYHVFMNMWGLRN